MKKQQKTNKDIYELLVDNKKRMNKRKYSGDDLDQLRFRLSSIEVIQDLMLREIRDLKRVCVITAFKLDQRVTKSKTHKSH